MGKGPRAEAGAGGRTFLQGRRPWTAALQSSTVPGMATIVTHRQFGGRFVVLGANLAVWKTARGHALFGHWEPVEKSGTARVLTVAGADGKIQFGNADEFRVVEVDGVALAELLGASGPSPDVSSDT